MATTQQNDGRNTTPVDASPNVVGTQEAAENAANVRGKTDPAWEHFPALDAAVAIGSGFKGPSYDELRVNLLGDCNKECQLLVESHRANWAKYGCMSFVKSVDASDIVKDASTLCHLFSEVIEWVGPQNVVHVVTDNAANYLAVGKLIHQKYENIFWTPCAAHCINLLLKDIGCLPHIADLASKASKVTIFIYNHMIFLSWLRKRSSWKEIVRPGVTRFATTFITLKSISDHKSDLQALVVNQHFTGHKLSTGKLVSGIILDSKFWRDCEVVSNIAAPIIRLLRIVDGDEKPSMGYVYDGMQRAKNAIMRMFRDKSELYKPYTDIISARWDKHLKHTLHAAAYFLNPGFFYDPSFVEKDRVVQSLVDLLEVKSLCASLPKALLELNVYRERKDSFSRASALQAASQIQPVLINLFIATQWWSIYGSSAPLLQKIAIRILSQTSSSSGCERNWSFFERIHTKKRNRLEHQKLSDHVYITYTLRLKKRSELKKRTYDPVDYECINNVDFWVVEEEASPEFDDNEAELENNIYEDDARDVAGGEEVGISEEPLMESVDFQIGANVESSSFDGIEINLNDVNDF
ncbi:uncharacterized protein LOC130712967 [Lotus japonicus]|uniref:uncharacterized protein LOC130712967 n=1 Tax=Lotus japonicus TaxID=34305 RepID=UPI002590BA97|nr:uncharacterized protein LOC130712967 [Lotus japonicus]